MTPASHEVAAVGGYRPEVDGLRMIAVLSVIFYHAGIAPFSGGYVGVDIFFVISGYLITAIIAREMDNRRFSFVEFYERRARRILPALFAMCAVTLAAALVLLTPEQLRHYGQGQFATMAFAANVYFYFRSGYFTPDIHTIPLIHMWSLAVEEQFYLVFPIALLIIARFVPRARNAIVLLVFVVSLAISIRSQESWPLGNFYLVPFRAWELMAGGLIALHEARFRSWASTAPTIARSAAWLGLALMLAPIAMYDDRTVFPGTAAIPVVLGTALIIATTPAGGAVRRVLSIRPFVAIGLISYSAYLWHQPLFAMVEIWRQSPPTMPIKVTLIALTLVLAWASLVLIERPFRDRRRISRKSVFLVAIAGTLAFAASGLALHVTRGLPQRYPAEVNALAATMQPSPKRDTCHTEGTEYRKPKDSCIYLGGPARWAVLGDSHGIEVGYALAERLRERDQSVVQLTFSGCAPALIMEMTNPGCSQWTREAVGWLGKERSVTDVLLVYRHPFYLYGVQTKTYPDNPNEAPPIVGDFTKTAARALYWRSMAAEIRALREAGKRVWVLGPVPDLPVPVERYVFGSEDGRTFAPPIPAQWFERRTALVRAMAHAVAEANGARFIDPALSLCTAGRCDWREGNQVLYFDDNHLSMVGARKIIDEQLAPRAGLTDSH